MDITIDDVRPAVERFAVEMELKLRKNDHKRGWEADGLWCLFDRMADEKDELEVLLGQHKRNPKNIVEEAADVANFAMMIADNAALRSGVPL